MGLQLLTPPAVEPVSLATAKAHLRVEHDHEDTLIGAYIAAARDHVERHTGRALLRQRVRATFDGFPAGRGALRLPRPPLAEVLAVTFTAPAGSEESLDAAAWACDAAAEPARLAPAPGVSWPATACQPGAVAVEFWAGLPAAADLPPSIVAAALLLVGHLYDNRAPVAIGTIATELPYGVTALLAPYRVWTVA
jgi:uncharacterized phiE125 gp8 family phage protein